MDHGCPGGALHQKPWVAQDITGEVWRQEAQRRGPRWAWDAGVERTGHLSRSWPVFAGSTLFSCFCSPNLGPIPGQPSPPQGWMLDSKGKGTLLPPEGITGLLFGGGGHRGAAVQTHTQQLGWAGRQHLGRSREGAGHPEEEVLGLPEQGLRLKFDWNKDPWASRAGLLPAPAWKTQINQMPYLI